MCREDDKDVVVSEIELEDCGSVGVETLRVHFGESATGLKYRSESGNWRLLRINRDTIAASRQGWSSEINYYLTFSESKYIPV